ncbi:MAG: amine dehydrogenase [Burkholderiaceae bacterium]|jgi:methylamine dehydrogenase heavy chain|nr:amine dehydrogenase [Burkholderiaceae bacterium]
MKAIIATNAAAVLLLTCAIAPAQTANKGAVPPPLAAETLTVAKLPPRNPHWIFAIDLAFANMVDARIILFDGQTDKRLGQISAGFAPAVAISPDGNTTAVATTYYARGSHGARTDVVEFYDNALLTPAAETVLPSKRAQTVPFAYNASYSADGRFLYVANITPAASISVVDAASHAMVGEIDMAGCVLAYPDGARRVSSLCENGKALTVTLDDAGKETGRQQSDTLFDVDKDPVFVSGVRGPKGMVFTSFLGDALDVDFSGDKAVVKDRWPLLSAAERKQGWRPGGLQVMAVQRSLGRLYVAMHQGGEGSHKDPASEIWVFDLNTHKQLARWNLAKQKIPPVLALQVSQDAQPQLSALTGNSDLVLMDGLTGKLRHIEKQFGSTSLLLFNP